MLKKKVLKAKKSKELERLVYHISHDLHEPIRTISRFLVFLKEKIPETVKEESSEYLKFIDGAVERIKKRVDGLTSYLLAENVEPKLISSDQVLNVLHQALGKLKSQIQSSKAEIQIEKSYPVVFVDPHSLELIFYHLIDNAIKFQKKGVVPRVKIKGEKIKNGFAQFSVSDNGIGIFLDYFDKIFNLFQRLHPIDEYAGVGVGLGVVKKSLDCHGGSIKIESTKDKGSTFLFTLPVELREST